MTQTPHPADGGPTGPTGPAAPPYPGPPPAQQPQSPWQPPSQSSRFWDDILATGLRRDRSRQWFAGVSSGIARRVDVDPVLIRAAFIALTLFGGFGIVAYLVAWLLLPDEDGRIMARDALSGGGTGATGAIVLSVIAVLVIAAIVFGDNGFLIGWGVIPLAIVAWLLWRHQQGRDGVPAWSSTAQGAPMPAGTPGGPDGPAGPAPTGPVPPAPSGASMYAATTSHAAVAPQAP
ncbi:PspC domain-containing protein, partial [Knoellia aerolata]